jgi:hypothetical protein
VSAGFFLAELIHVLVCFSFIVIKKFDAYFCYKTAIDGDLLNELEDIDSFTILLFPTIVIFKAGSFFIKLENSVTELVDFFMLELLFGTNISLLLLYISASFFN